MTSRTKAWSQRLMNEALVDQSVSNEKQSEKVTFVSTDANKTTDTPSLSLTKPDEEEAATAGSIRLDEQRRRAA